MGHTVLLAGFKHESRTFTGETTDRDDFGNRRELYGGEIPDSLRGTNTEIGGIIDIADREDVGLLYTVAASAQPGGPVDRRTYEHYLEHILDAVRDHHGAVDGIVLPLHGAMVAEHLDDGEGPLVERIQDVVDSTVPIVVTIDPNANVSDRLTDAADAIVAYETTPHVDQRETGRTGMWLLVRAMRGEIEPAMHVERPPVVPSAVRSTTLEAPLAELQTRARELESRDELLKVNVCQGFWSADVPHMGFSVVAVADGTPTAARDAARELARRVWDRREEFIEDTPSAEEGVRRAREQVERAGDTPVVVAEMHDNPGGGSPADGTRVLRELLEQEVTDAALAIMCDPDAVETCVAAGVGERVEVDLGGSGTPAVYGAPIRGLEGYVKSVTDGRYRFTGPMFTGTEAKLGRAVRLQCGPDDGIEVVLSENRVQCYDGEAFRHVGISPERLDLIAVKSAVHYRAFYGTIADEMISIDESPTPEYERISRPRYPLDPMDDDDYPDWGN